MGPTEGIDFGVTPEKTGAAGRHSEGQATSEQLRAHLFYSHYVMVSFVPAVTEQAAVSLPSSAS